MTAGDLITEDYEIEYNEVLFGGESDLQIVEFSPFQGVDMRSSDLERPLDHGMFPGIDYYGGRTIDIELEAWGGWATLVEAMTALQTQTEDLPLVFQLPTVGKLLINCRVRRRSGMTINQAFNVADKAAIVAELYACDPRVYSNTLKTASINPTGTTDGMTFNATFNLTFGDVDVSTAACENEGTFETRPQVRIVGPIDNPFLENQTTGKVLLFNGSLSTGEMLDVDFLNRTVLLNETASRYSWVDDSAGWWTLMPGSNTIRLGGSTSGTPSCTISWRDAYV